MFQYVLCTVLYALVLHAILKTSVIVDIRFVGVVMFVKLKEDSVRKKRFINSATSTSLHMSFVEYSATPHACIKLPTLTNNEGYRAGIKESVKMDRFLTVGRR